MSASSSAPAMLSACSDGVEALFARRLGHSTAKVWAALTRPEWLVTWLAPGEIEPRFGGTARLAEGSGGIVVDGKVTWCRPRLLLEYSWSGPSDLLRLARWRLWPVQGGATDLTLRLRLPVTADVAQACAGWEMHLDMLAVALVGVEARFPTARFKARRASYAHQLGRMTALEAA